MGGLTVSHRRKGGKGVEYFLSEPALAASPFLNDISPGCFQGLSQGPSAVREEILRDQVEHMNMFSIGGSLDIGIHSIQN